MITRRHALALLAAASVPSRLYAGPPELEVRGGLAQRFAGEGTAGVFAAVDSGRATFITSDDRRAGEAILPASTFKIPLSIIALETGIVADPDLDVFAWDGVVRSFPDWNRDHTLRSAIAASAVPVYQEIARRIGMPLMRNSVAALDYGNRDIHGAPIDAFWLRGNLRIAPIQQVTFAGRLQAGSLPVSKRSQDLTRDILPVTKVGSSLIRAKTGLVGVDENSPAGAASATIGWLVGWAEKGSTATPFALNLDIREPRHIESRMKLAQQLLADIGAI